MSMQETIQQKLTDSFSPSHIEVENESNMHNVPPGSESHFKVVVVSELFQDKSLIQRHRMINQSLQEELQSHIHALAIHTYTQNEWAEKEFKDLKSPPCHGGGK